jgi:S1-C subfamily serine protease
MNPFGEQLALSWGRTTGSEGSAASPPRPRRRLRPFLTGMAVALVFALSGAVIAHLAWAGGSVSPTASASTPVLRSPFARYAPTQAGAGGISPASSSSGGSSATSTAVSAVAGGVDPGLVDINTSLGQEGAAAGTGMVVTSSGEVITNNHVIVGATSISVTDIGNGKTYKARVIGYDASQDVAVLQLIGASGLKTVKLGNSSTVTVGESVSTIGNAGGAGGAPSVANGTVTGLNQSITASDDVSGDSEHLTGLIELNGSLQPGDSGGPLVNSAGEVVGMDTAASSGFSFQSASGDDFAIPINEVLSLAKQIEAGQSSSAIHIGATALIGVEVSSTPQYGFDRSSSTVQGAYVAGVEQGTPAAAVGITAGDTITGFNGHAITSATALTNAKNSLHPGDKVTITWADASGNTHTATVKLASGGPPA